MSRDFDDLTPRGQRLRLRGLAIEALREYALEVTRVSFAARAFNTVFRVDAADGSTYALRVGSALRIHADGCEALEAAWVAAIRRDTGLAVAQVIPTRDGAVDTWVQAPGVSEPRSCVLFEWVPGRPLRERMRADLARKTGALTATVHEQAASDTPAAASTVPRGALGAERVLYLRVEDRLDELRPTYGSVLAEAVDRAQLTLDALGQDPPHRPHLLHGDIQPSNVMVARGEVTLIDFQDLIWGYEIQDLAIAFCALRNFDGADALTAAFLAGYESMRPWPDADAETFAALVIARHLNLLNFGLSVRGPGLDAFVARQADPVIAWMG